MKVTLSNMVSTILTGILLLPNLLTYASAKPHHRHHHRSSSSSSSPATCNDPTRKEIEDLWHKQGAWHESIFNLDAMSNVEITRDDIDQSYVNVKEHSLKDPVCPFGQGSREELERYREQVGANAPLCPTHDVINYDENRRPSTLFSKNCSCTECGLPPSRERISGQHSADSTLGCMPVYYYAKVLRRVNCVEGKFIYDTVLEPLVVACVCDHRSRPDSTRRKRIHSEK